MQRKIPALVLTAALTAIAAPASALFTEFLDRSPMAYFTDKDREMLNAASRDALNGADGATTDWKNTETGHGGSVTPLNSYERDGRPCRAVRFHNEAEGYASDGTFEMCKAGDEGPMGGWKFTGDKPVAK